MEKNAIYKIIKTEDNGYGNKIEFEISFNQKTNTWNVIELVLIGEEQNEYSSRLIGQAEEFEGLEYLLK